MMMSKYKRILAMMTVFSLLAAPAAASARASYIPAFFQKIGTLSLFLIPKENYMEERNAEQYSDPAALCAVDAAPGGVVDIVLVPVPDAGPIEYISGTLEYDHDIFECLTEGRSIDGDRVFSHFNRPVPLSFRVRRFAPPGACQIGLSAPEVHLSDDTVHEDTRVFPLQVNIVRPAEDPDQTGPDTGGQDASCPMEEAVLIGGERQTDFHRETPILAPHPDQYSFWEGGVFTFRGDNFRRNASFGTANIAENRMTILWQKELSSLRTSGGTVSGVGWTGQPAIVKWVGLAREMMTTMYPEMRQISGLREVIFAAQDGNVYFLNLSDGKDTRDPICIGYPLRGSVSVYPQYAPLFSFGQSASEMDGEDTGDIGHYLYNLIDSSRTQFISGRPSDRQRQYANNGAFDGTALMIQNPAVTDAGDMIVAGENGLLYTVHLNYQLNNRGLKVRADEPVVLQSKAADAEDARAGVEGSPAMYNQYVFFADGYGALRCVDTTGMTTVWSADMGDNTDASVALDLDDSGRLWLYTGNTSTYRLNDQDVSIRRLDAMTGEIDWTYSVRCVQDRTGMSGCKASPVIGQKNISDLVFFTVNRLTGGGSKLAALDKETGRAVWEYTFSAEAVSSPVAVYGDSGDARIIQADRAGVLHMFDARSGQHLSELDLGGEIQASPAVYKNILVIGTCSEGNARMYGIELR